MTTTTDYTPPKHMTPGGRGFDVASVLWRTALERWEDAGKPRDIDDPDSTFVTVARVLIAIGGLHDGWLPPEAVDGVDPADLEPILDLAMPSKKEVPDLTANVKPWKDWVRTEVVPPVRAFALKNGIPWKERE